MEIYIKTENGLQLLFSGPSVDEFNELKSKVDELENQINQK